METYKIHIRCTNCDYKSATPNAMVEIDKGVSIDAKLLDYKCPVCGCKTVRKN
jgi:Zn finger protein HypA/HybF involved in hydrogenase expression